MRTIVRRKTHTTLPKYWTHAPHKVRPPSPHTNTTKCLFSHQTGNLTIIGQHPRRTVEVARRKPHEAGGGFHNDPHESYEQASLPSLFQTLHPQFKCLTSVEFKPMTFLPHLLFFSSPRAAKHSRDPQHPHTSAVEGTQTCRKRRKDLFLKPYMFPHRSIA